MNILKNLPEDYQKRVCIDIRQTRSLLRVNLVALILLVFFGGLFWLFLRYFRPVETWNLLMVGPFTQAGKLVDLLIFLFLLAFTLLIHELIHGFFFSILTGTKPRYAFKGAYAYAAAPGIYIRQSRYIWIAIAPFAIITLTGLLLLLVVPADWVTVTALMTLINASGSAGDLWVVWELVRCRKNLILDEGDCVTFFARETNRT
jgi:hypothetical protein